MITVQARVKGSGKCTFSLQLRTAKDEHIGQTEKGGSFQLSSEWQEKTVTLKVVNPPGKVTGKVLITISGAKGSELYITGIKVTTESAEFVGNARFPKEWTVFANVDSAATPPLSAIPAAIDGVKGVRVLLNGSKNTLDFRPFFPARKLKNCAWAFAVLKSDSAGDYTIGAGADYFMAYYVNGEKVLDTLAGGNAVGEPHFNNYLATVKLKKGDNILAVKFLSGSGLFPRLCLGGADELRGLTAALNVTKRFQCDEYERPAVRGGNPELIRDYPTPGWLTITGQGVYRPGKIVLASEKYRLPVKGSGQYFATGVRVQSFRHSAATAALNIGNRLKLQMNYTPDRPEWTIAFMRDGQTLKSLSLPTTALPADVLLAIHHHGYCVNIASLADGKLRSFEGTADFSDLGDFTTDIDFAGAPEARLTLDNYFTGLAERETKSNDIPFKAEIAATFDPVQAGWPLVWRDEFDGDKVDTETKWFLPSWSAKTDRPDYLTVKDGILHIRGALEAGRKKPQTVGIRSRDTFLFGYFEARVRFTRHPGWWAAFWLLEEGGSMPTGGGSEIDVFEDYATRRADRTIANNFHTFMGEKIKSFGYTFKLPGSLDDFYVIGAKWTPFETSIYLNGKLVKSTAGHSPWQSLTYDAMNHAFPTAPNRLIVSGQAGSSGGKATAPFVEEYLVDYVRVYAYPRDRDPEVKWVTTPEKNIIRAGETVRLAGAASPSPKSRAAITGAYLFDNGYLLDYKTTPPYAFELPVTAERYAQSRWGKPGASGLAPEFDGYPHFYQIAVQDAAGNVAYTEPVPVIVMDQASSPYQNQAATIPGTLTAGRFDDGAANSAYYKIWAPKKPFDRKQLTLVRDGAWVNYTVKVAASGPYSATIRRLPVRDVTQGKNYYPDIQVTLFVDGKIAGVFKCRKDDQSTTIAPIHLSAGTQVLTVMVTGAAGVSFSEIEFKKQ